MRRPAAFMVVTLALGSALVAPVTSFAGAHKRLHRIERRIIRQADGSRKIKHCFTPRQLRYALHHLPPDIRQYAPRVARLVRRELRFARHHHINVHRPACR